MNQKINHTKKQYDQSVNKCRSVFEKKTLDYGTAWRILRTHSLTDQLYIKAMRIRTIEETGENKVDEGIENEFIGIVNYAAMALIQLESGHEFETEMSRDEVLLHYNKVIYQAYRLMTDKNHDYGEAWRNMRVSSMTDLILMKLLRIKQIEDNKGVTLISEGIDANYYDIINYAVFALIKINDTE
jgi:Nucleotide modification associated domain 1